MSRRRTVVALTDQERDELRGLVRTGTHAARTITRAHILLLSATGDHTVASICDVLELYAQPPQPGVARLAIDERPCVLHDDVLAPLPLKPGAVTKQDNHYERNGTAVALLAYNIDTGQRYVEVRPQRTKQDYAAFVQAAIRCLCPEAQRVAIVNDNLNTHTVGAFYETFDAATARQLAGLVRFHYTPKHASWLGYPLGVGRNRVLSAGAPVFRSADRDDRAVDRGSCGVGRRAERASGHHPLEFYRAHRTAETAPALPTSML